MREQDYSEEITIDIGEMLLYLKSRLSIIILAGIAGLLISFLYTKLVVTPVFESTTKIYVLSKQDSRSVTQMDLTAGTQLTKDYMELVKSRTVSEQVNSEMDLNLTHEELINMLTVESPEDTRILSITAANKDPKLARDIADHVRIAATKHMKEVMDLDAVNVVEKADFPETPSKPVMRRNLMVGAAAGLLLAIGILVGVFLLDDTIKTADDVEKYLELSVLGTIPIKEKEQTRGKERPSAKRKNRKAG